MRYAAVVLTERARVTDMRALRVCVCARVCDGRTA